MLNLSRESSELNIRPFEHKDISLIVSEFARHHWHKPPSTFALYWEEQIIHARFMWVAFYQEQFAGYVTLKWESSYPSFKKQQIPEIMDLNVLPPYRGKGIASRLLALAECLAFTKSTVVGLGVGLYQDYGNAQKLYIKKGYIPDGLGITHNYKAVIPGNNAPIDDDLVLWFTKKLNIIKKTTKNEVISIDTAPFFTWGQKCSGWWLKNEGNFSVIYEQMPAKTSETKHYHHQTEQFFYCLQGELTMIFEDSQCTLKIHEGINVKPGVSHQVKNLSENTVAFLVISSPNLLQDRVNL